MRKRPALSPPRLLETFLCALPGTGDRVEDRGDALPVEVGDPDDAKAARTAASTSPPRVWF